MRKRLRGIGVAIWMAASLASAQTSGSLNTQNSNVWNAAPWMITSGPGTFPTGGGVATLLPQLNTEIGFPPDQTVLTITNAITLSGFDFQGPFRWRIQSGGPGSLALSASGATVGADLPDFGQRYVIASPMSGGGALGLTKVGAGTLTLGGANSYTGGTHVNAGVLEVTSGDGALGATGAGNGVSLDGGTLRLSGSSFTTSRAISVGAGDGAIDSLVTGTATFNGVIGGANDLVVGITNGGVTFTADNTLSGVVSLGARTLLATLSGANGAFRFASGYNFLGVLANLDSTSANNNNRLSDTAPINIGSNAAIFLVGNSAASTTEIAGALNVIGTARIAINANTGNQPSLNFASINRQNNAPLFITGSNLGDPPAPFVAQITSAAAPVPLVGGGGAPGSTIISILPWMTGKNTTAGQFDGMRHVTYNPVTDRLRAISTAEYADAFGGAATNNVRLTTSTAAPATTVNALLFAPPSPATLSGGTITITTGSFIHSPTSNFFPAVSTVSAGLNFGAAEGIIHATSNANFTGAITGSNGLTLSPRGFTIGLSSPNTYTGQTTMFEGVVQFSGDIPNDGVTPNPFGLSTSAIVLRGGAILEAKEPAPGGSATVHRTVVSQTNFTVIPINPPPVLTSLDRAVISNASAGPLILSDVEMDLRTGIAFAARSAPIVIEDMSSDGGTTYILGEPNFVEFAGNNTSTGDLHLESGAKLRIAANNATGTGAIRIEAGFSLTTVEAVGASRTVSNPWQLFGTVKFGGNHDLTLSGEFGLNGNRSLEIDPLAFVDITGPLVDGLLHKLGGGTLGLSRAEGNTYTGGTRATAGTLNVNNTTGSATGPGTVEIGVAATLAGSFIVQGVTEILGQLKPGNPVGTASFGSNLIFGATTQSEIELASSASADKVNVVGMLTLDGTVRVVSLGGYVGQLGHIFDLVDWGTVDASNFTLGDLDLGAPTAAGTAWGRSQFLNNGTIQVAVDGDGDGLTDNDESTLFGSDPTRADSDGDGMNDAAEVRSGTNPNDPFSRSVLRRY